MFSMQNNHHIINPGSEPDQELTQSYSHYFEYRELNDIDWSNLGLLDGDILNFDWIRQPLEDLGPGPGLVEAVHRRTASFITGMPYPMQRFLSAHPPSYSSSALSSTSTERFGRMKLRRNEFSHLAMRSPPTEIVQQWHSPPKFEPSADDWFGDSIN